MNDELNAIMSLQLSKNDKESSSLQQQRGAGYEVSYIKKERVRQRYCSG